MNRDWLEKDFYRLLKVSEDADQATIKKSYRRLAQELHPDANPDSPDAADRFKEVSEAYSVLSDPQRRQEYDQVRRLGTSGFGTGFGRGGGHVRIEDLFGGAGGIGSLFNFGRGGRGPQRGEDTAAAVDLSFDQSIFGATVPVSVSGSARCSKCSGSGAEPGSRVDVCARCGGGGTVASNQGVFSFTNPCPACGGSGRTIEKRCRACRGSGHETRSRAVRVRIPPGVKDGATIRVRGRGNPGSSGGPAGDLMVQVRVRSHPFFSRKNDDLTLQLPLTFTEAALGTKVKVPTMAGSVTLRIPPGTPSGKTFRIRKEGVRHDRFRSGDLLVTTQVMVPEGLPRDAKKLLKDFKEKYENADPREHLS